MKKTLTLLIAMGSFAVSSEAATVFNYYTPGTDNYNSTIHGLYLSLGTSSLAPSDSSSPPPCPERSYWTVLRCAEPPTILALMSLTASWC